MSAIMQNEKHLTFREVDKSLLTMKIPICAGLIPHYSKGVEISIRISIRISVSIRTSTPAPSPSWPRLEVPQLHTVPSVKTAKEATPDAAAP